MSNEESSRKNLLQVIDTKTKVLALVCLVLEGALLASLPQLPDEDRLYAFMVGATVLALMVAGIFFVEFKEGQISKIIGLKSTHRLNENTSKEQLLLLDTYPRSQHPNFFNEVETLVPCSKNITLVATGLNLIWNSHILEILISRARSGEANVTVCLGNPYSPHIEDRLIEEEMRDRSPPAAKEGIKKHIKNLIKKLDAAGNPPNFKFLLFNHYPTLATLTFDNEIFVYPYGYQVLGNTSPIFHFKDNGSQETEFFKENTRLIIEDAVPAKQVFLAKTNPNYFSRKWISLAVFIIPNERDAIYKYGSSVLGYDIRQKKDIDRIGSIKELAPFVGEASQYGFHLTVADALYFLSNSEVDRIKAELSMLSNEFHPFVLDNFDISNKFRNGSDVVLTCRDETGTVEALHHELVSRMYRAAISSNYISRQTEKVELATNRRAELMINKYAAPFILKKFTPHFTLCSAMPISAEKRSEALGLLNDTFQDSCDSDHIRIDEIFLLSRGKDQDKWEIIETYPLVGK